MDTGWIQIFILTVAECVAPAGKTVCQESEFELQFLTQAECEIALEQLVTLKDESQSVIVDRERSSCTASARKLPVFGSLAEVTASLENPQDFRAPDLDNAESDTSPSSHQTRLDVLKSCDETQGVAPCKIGEIIIEEATAPHSVEVWRRD